MRPDNFLKLQIGEDGCKAWIFNWFINSRGLSYRKFTTMVLKQSALQKRAIKLELEGLQKTKSNPPCLFVLDKILHDVYVVGRPMPNDYLQRGDLVRVFNMLAKEVYGISNDFPVVEAFGSFLMNMFSTASDLDLSVNFSNESVELPRDKKIKALRKLSKKLYLLQSEGHVFGVTPILSAKVPILKVVDRGTRVECDISVENRDGILKSQFILIVSEIDERFQKLSSLMKAWAKAYNINSSRDSTLNSLSIILLVAFHLQTREPPILPPFSALLKDGINPGGVKNVVRDYLQYGKGNKESIAELFTTLLSKLASVETLWPGGLCASTYEGSWISKTWKSKVGIISVEDFTDRSQNVARAVGKNGMRTIYKSINSSLHHLSAFMGGLIDGPKLNTLLFGAKQVPTDENTKNLKRNFPVNPVMAKKARTTKNSNPWEEDQTHQPDQTEGWGSWGRSVQTNGTIQKVPINAPIPPENPPLMTPGFNHGFQHGPTEFRRPRGFENWSPSITTPTPENPLFGHGSQLGPTELWGSHASQHLPFPASRYSGSADQVNSGVTWNPTPKQTPAPTPTPNVGGPYNTRSFHSPSGVPGFGHGFEHGPTEFRGSHASQHLPFPASWYTVLQKPAPTPNAGGHYNPRSTHPSDPTFHPHGSWAL